MHCCCLLITKEFPTEALIYSIMEPYYEDDWFELEESERPELPFMWDWYEVGGRYGGLLALDLERKKEKYNLEFYSRVPRSGRLFRSNALEYCNQKNGYPIEEKYFPYMGSRNGILYVDGGFLDDMKEINAEGYILIDKDGTVYCRKDNPKYPEQVRAAIENGKDCYICIIDIHH